MADGNRGNRLKTGTIAAHQALMFDKLLTHKHERFEMKSIVSWVFNNVISCLVETFGTFSVQVNNENENMMGELQLTVSVCGITTLDYLLNV